MSTTDVQTDFVTSTQHYGDVVKLQDHWVKHLTTLEIAMISAACFVVLLIILILCSLSAFLIRRYCFQQRLQGTRESFPESQVSVNVGRAIYYKPDQFEHRGPLVVKREMNFEKDGKTDPALDVDTNPKDAHFYFTEKEGNVVFDVGSQVECIVP